VASLRLIKQAGNFDLIHDHNHLIGPALIASSVGLPPALHTLHGPFATADRMEQGLVDCTPAFGELARSSQVHYNGISEAQLRSVPQAMRPRIVGAIHHGIDPTLHLFQRRKGDYFVNVGRMAAEKGIATAARLAAKMGAKLKLGGVVAGITGPAQLAAELSQADSDYQKFADFVYFRDQVAPQMQTGTVEYVGAVAGLTKDRLIGGAKAFLMPIEWEEPFGVAIIDALVCGTPVVAMRRGSLPEIIEHGVNGFLADNEEEFAYYMTKVDEIDPAACRRSVEQRFSYRAMAGNYLTHYKRLIGRQSEVPVALPAKRRFAFYERLTKPAEDVDQAGAGG
jgi:glycosyltransferase involved in cell wall biosynthesis